MINNPGSPGHGYHWWEMTNSHGTGHIYFSAPTVNRWFLDFRGSEGWVQEYIGHDYNIVGYPTSETHLQYPWCGSPYFNLCEPTPTPTPVAEPTPTPTPTPVGQVQAKTTTEFTSGTSTLVVGGVAGSPSDFNVGDKIVIGEGTDNAEYNTVTEVNE